MRELEPQKKSTYIADPGRTRGKGQLKIRESEKNHTVMNYIRKGLGLSARQCFDRTHIDIEAPSPRHHQSYSSGNDSRQISLVLKMRVLQQAVRESDMESRTTNRILTSTSLRRISDLRLPRLMEPISEGLCRSVTCSEHIG